MIHSLTRARFAASRASWLNQPKQQHALAYRLAGERVEKRQGNGRMGEVKLAVDNARVLKRNHACEKAACSTSDCSCSIEGASCALHLRSRFIVVCSHREQWRKGSWKAHQNHRDSVIGSTFWFPQCPQTDRLLQSPLSPGPVRHEVYARREDGCLWRND